jgi:hypothetical protein
LCGGHCFGGRNVPQKYGKFVTAESSGCVVLAEIAQEPPADFLKQQIAGRVAKTVINFLEAVKVEAKKSARAFFVRGGQGFV